MSDTKSRNVSRPQRLEVFCQANFASSARNTNSKFLEWHLHVRNTLQYNHSTSFILSLKSKHLVSYLYIFAVFPSNSGIAISGAVVGNVTGICKYKWTNRDEMIRFCCIYISFIRKRLIHCNVCYHINIIGSVIITNTDLRRILFRIHIWLVRECASICQTIAFPPCWILTETSHYPVPYFFAQTATQNTQEIFTFCKLYNIWQLPTLLSLNQIWSNTHRN